MGNYESKPDSEQPSSEISPLIREGSNPKDALLAVLEENEKLKSENEKLKTENDNDQIGKFDASFHRNSLYYSSEN